MATFRDFGGQPQATDTETLLRHFGNSEALPLWIAEPDLPLLPELTEGLTHRAAEGWFGYETRPAAVVDAFWEWAAARHGWDGGALRTMVSPSVGTSIGVVIDAITGPGDGVVLQPPVFTDFKPLVASAGRTLKRNPLTLADGRYGLDLDQLADLAGAPDNRLLILCNPHNPVARVWTAEELAAVAAICAANDVFVLADEIHADLALAPHRFTPFGPIAAEAGCRWAATHGPIKTFGLAGVADTFLITDDEELAERFAEQSSRLHLTRNNVFALTASEVAYRRGAAWLDDMLGQVAANAALLRDALPAGIGMLDLEGTYLAWIDFRSVGVPVPELGRWLAEKANVATSPGHWFGREGAGFARLTLAVEPQVIEAAAEGIRRAVLQTSGT